MNMRNGLVLITVIVLGACASAPKEPETPALDLGINQESMDTSVRPQDDLFRFVNGTWLETTEIPADKSNYGSFSVLLDKAEEDLRVIIEETATTEHPAGTDEQKVADFYRAYMDTELVAQKGLTPIEQDLSRIHAISNHAELVDYIGYSQRTGIADPFGFFVDNDLTDSTRYMGYMWQTGLGLPNREYYFDDEFSDVRVAYVEYITDLLSLAGVDDAADKADTIMSLETRLAGAHWDKVRNRDPNERYNLFTIVQANTLTPGFDWNAFLNGAGIHGQTEIVLSQPSYFEEATRALSDEPISTWKTYFTYKLINSATPYVTEDFVELNFDFYGRTLRGTEQNQQRWKRAVQDTDNMLGEAVGKVYVERHYPPEAKARMDEMIANLREAFRISINNLEWMGPETKAQAQDKLQKFTPKIGYPEKWRDYSALAIEPDDLVGNMARSVEFEFQRNVDKLGAPIDRTEWFMTPQTVNAYYNPNMNEIVFPAAILQPPFFNVEADDATNYGAIGAVIGHEFSHGFDDQGRKYDGEGNLRDWWTEEDNARFQTRAKQLGEQYSSYNPIDDMHVNGEFTMGENIGDMAGLTMAHRAYLLSLKGGNPPVIDGFSGDQRFFMGWAQVWRRLYRDDELRRRIKVDPHSPSEYRANGTVVNIDAFHETFETEEGDELYKATEDRVRIW
ncbi:MAG: M13-type metalloendopeptidase [Gammaproteobacteria bacterium]